MDTNTTFLWLNGKIIPESEARISVRDRGFLFGDGVFETIRVHASRLAFWPRHEKRLMRGLSALSIALPEMDWPSILDEVIAANEMREGVLRITISRGVGSNGYAPSKECHTPTILVDIRHKNAPDAHPAAARMWLSAYTKPTNSHYPVSSKTLQGLNSVLARMEADERGYDEALLLNDMGQLCEASGANLFWLRYGRLYTPPLSTGCLAGVTREWLMKHAALEVEEATMDLPGLMQADEVMLTNVQWGVRPAAELAPQNMQWPERMVADRLQAEWIAALAHDSANQ